MANTTNVGLPTIVYVEDNAGDALILEEALRTRQHAVELLVIDHGARALHYFKIKESARDLPPPHCILLDNHMPAVTGMEIMQFIRGSPVYNATPVYIFAPQSAYRAIQLKTRVSLESFITKPENWAGFLQLADLLMGSVQAKLDHVPANSVDDQPEVHAQGPLRAEH
jgi:CheY-like chemotaxis protein